MRDVDKQVRLGELFQFVDVRHRNDDLLEGIRGLMDIFATGQRTFRAEGVIFPGKMMIPL